MSPFDEQRKSIFFLDHVFFLQVFFFSLKHLDILTLYCWNSVFKNIYVFQFKTFKNKGADLSLPCQSNLFLNSRLHLVVALVPLVVMAKEQEVNQHSIISHPAPGGSGSSRATTPLPFGTPASLGTPLIATPCSISVGYRQCVVFVPGCFCDTASKKPLGGCCSCQ